ncbi:MAG: hypothetical protein JW751_26970 [Polyangiaceae bacterium]|nr:hypothetical protein [Polyangiaceae bacterium]
MSTTHYRHTQVGWVTLVALVLIAGTVGGLLATAELWAALGALIGLLLAIAVIFSTLTVEVDQHQLRFHFGLGFPRKRIPLADVRQYAAVQNPWWYGWGIHVTPRGVLYNVSGLDAVELRLQNGKCLRVGSDEPGALCRALEEVLGRRAPLSAAEVAQGRRQSRRALVVLAAVLSVTAIGVAALFYFHEQPPQVTLTSERIRVASALYDEEFALGEITRLSLETRLPRIRLRTNGYAAGDTLRGHFRLEEFGDGQLFLEYGHPPYILMRGRGTYVAVNFADPTETNALYRRLEPLWQTARER